MKDLLRISAQKKNLDIRGLIKVAYKKRFDQAIEKERLNRYYNLYLGQKIIPTWLDDYCLITLSGTEAIKEYLDAQKEHLRGVYIKSEEEIQKCCGCTMPLVNSVIFYKGDIFCSPACINV